MNSITRSWRNWKHARKFTKTGGHCQFPGEHLEVEGHVELGRRVRVRNNVILRANPGGKIIIGDRSGLSYYVIIEASELVEIGERTAFAEFCVIRDSNHMVFGTERHWRLTPLVAQPIHIGNDCLIGSRCYIMPGVTIGDGAVIQVGSVITTDVGSYEVWAGNPARKIAHRTRNVPKLLLAQSRALVKKYGIKTDRWDEDPKARTVGKDDVAYGALGRKEALAAEDADLDDGAGDGDDAE